MSRQTFLQGILILLLAGLLSRILGFLPKMILPRIIGTEGIGLYQMAYPILIFFLTIARFGMNVSVSKIVAEAEANGDLARIRQTLVISAAIVSGLSLGLIPVVVAASLFLARTFYTDERVLYPLLAMVPIIPVIALSTIIRGYFQGRNNMVPTAASSVIEAFFRILGVILLSSLLLPYGLGWAAAGVMIGVGIGEIASLAYLASRFRPLGKQLFRRKTFLAKGSGYRKTFLDLWNISLPVTASGLIGSVSYALEPVLVAQSLALAGIGAAAATSLYGELGGLAIYLVWFPTTLTYSLSVSLVPAISEAHARKKHVIVRQRLNQSLRLAMVAGTPFAVVFYVFAEPLCSLLFDAPQVAPLLKILAPFSLFLYFQAPLAAALQGLNMARAAFYNSLYGALVKNALILLLGSQSFLHIRGVCIAINCSMMLVTLLHFFTITRRVKVRLNWLDYLKTGTAGLLTGIFSCWLQNIFLVRTPGFLSLIVSLVLSFLAYTLLLILLRALGKQDVLRIPYLGKWLAPFFPYR